MAKLMLVGCALLVLFNVCLGSQDRKQQFQRGNECQIDRLTALEPTRRIEAEGGVTEFWDSSAQEFKCAGVTVVRRTIQPKGLLLPSYTSSPELVYTLEGRAIIGLLIPGCPETFESGSQQSWERQEESDDERSRSFQDRRQEGSDYERSRRFQDRHQKIRRLKEGDVAVVPAGVAHWVYNDGHEPMVDIILIDTSNSLNQLDQDVPRRFYLAGRPEQESGQEHHKGQGQQGKIGNVLGAFDTRVIAESFGVSQETARKLQCEQDERGNIILVQEGLQVISPPRRIQEEEQRQSRDDSNGVEEMYCSARIIENLDDPERADVYTTGAGRISTLNSFNLPILKQVKLSAEKGVLYRNAIFAPHYSLNAHDILYVVNGRAHIQIVDDQGNRVFDGELSKGQLVVVPQNFAALKKASEDGFEWISFKTSENAMFQTLAGRSSAIRAMPVEVVSNIYQIPREQAQRLKYSRKETTMFRSQGRALDA